MVEEVVSFLYKICQYFVFSSISIYFPLTNVPIELSVLRGLEALMTTQIFFILSRDATV